MHGVATDQYFSCKMFSSVEKRFGFAGTIQDTKTGFWNIRVLRFKC